MQATFSFLAYSPRRSARVSHLCSFRPNQTKNTTWRRARRERGNIIHADGVRSDSSPSAFFRRSGPHPRITGSSGRSRKLCGSGGGFAVQYSAAAHANHF